MVSPVIGTTLQRSEACTVYDSATSPRIEHRVGTNEVPVTPVSLEALRVEQIDIVIDRLTNNEQPLPAPFSKQELYRTGADVGIPVWIPEQKDEFTDRVTDRLDYTWDEDSLVFFPRVGEQLVEKIKAAANTIIPSLASTSQLLRDDIDAWCETHGIDSSRRKTVLRIVARQAVFERLLRSVLCEYNDQCGEVPTLPDDLPRGVRQAGKQTEDPVFCESILDEIVCFASEEKIEAVVDERHRLLYSPRPAEDIGALYESLIPKEERRELGQHRTPPELGELMRTWAATGNNTVLDPGMGAGGLSTPCHPRWSVSTDPARVLGVDRSPLALHMGITAQRLAGQAHEPLASDFLSLSPDDLDEAVDAIICNPPYTRHHELPTTYKEMVIAQAEEETGRTISAVTPLYAYFWYHARQFLDTGDRAAIITPQSWLATNYGESLKQFLLDEFDVKALVQFDPAGERVFETAQTTALIAFLEAKECTEPVGTTRFVRIDEWPGTATLREAVNSRQHGSTDWGFVNRVEQTQLSPCRNWQALFDPHSIDTSSLTPLGDLVTIHRGKTTGCVDFFCLSQADVEAAELDEQCLSRLIRRPMYIDGYDFRDEDWEELQANDRDVWLFDPDELPGVPASAQAFREQVVSGSSIESDGEEHELSEVVEYLREGVTDHDLHEIGCLANRSYWYRPRREHSRRVLVRNASRDGFRFVLNEATARHTNNMYAFYDVALSELELKALLAFLNSDVFDLVVRDYKKTRDGGFDAIQPSELESVPVLDPTSLPGEVVTRLAELFDDLREMSRQNNDCEPVQDQISSVIETQIEQSSNPVPNPN
ncbi:Eco57I restriction-modification methylase domain-containing protein [Halosolutus amylolyticus]|uniref:site-specific DNA-methyltransferase (adenine-specific) n=1 Tax=Halosolutus amylolyticus TaxID=2932267 RepID=A0ABD5PJU8_9EURY|nr:N-6 DNA methylase [Halosolutus amylolyticus]